MAKDGKGYMIPDDPLPPDDICIRVFVPNDVKYIAAFWGAYEYFTTWKAWQRDTEKTGLVCGGRWKSSFQQARELFDSGLYGEDCDMPFDVRQSPVDPCILEKSDDGGVTWVDFALLNLCDEVIVIPPYPEGDGELPGADAGTEVLRRVLIMINEWRDLGYSQDLTRHAFVEWLSGYARVDFSIVADGLIKAIYALPSQQVLDAIDTADWQIMRDELYCSASVDFKGGIQPNGITFIINSLNTMADQIFDFLGLGERTLFDQLNLLAEHLGADGVTNAATDWVSEGKQGELGFGVTTCGWVEVFDFTESSHGFVHDVMSFWSPPVAGLHDDRGWTSTLSEKNTVPNSFAQMYSITKQFPATNVTRINVTVEIPLAAASQGLIIYAPFYGDGQGPTVRHTLRTDLSVGVDTYLWAGNIVMDGVGFSCQVSQPYDDNTVILSRVVIAGEGLNPFAV